MRDLGTLWLWMREREYGAERTGLSKGTRGAGSFDNCFAKRHIFASICQLPGGHILRAGNNFAWHSPFRVQDERLLRRRPIVQAQLPGGDEFGMLAGQIACLHGVGLDIEELCPG